MAISEKKKEYHRAYKEANKEKIKETNKAYRETNKEKIKEYLKAYKAANKEKIKETTKAYLKANKEKIKEKMKAYQGANKEKMEAYREANKEKMQAYREANKEKRNEYSRTYRKTNPEGKLIMNMRSRIFKIIKINQKVKNKRTLELLGCDGKFLKKHLQKKFSKGMSWNNYGEWHVDHIVPIDYFLKNFDFNDVEIQKECFNYKNLQPLWSIENIKKGSKI